MKIHVLPGDALAAAFRESAVEGEVAVCRECLVDGPLAADSLEEFWDVRAGFIAAAHGAGRDEYFARVVAEFEKILGPGVAEINLWFEHELFCQANYWFCLDLLRASGARIYRVAPLAGAPEDIWKGFGALAPAALEACFAARVPLGAADRARGAALWRAFRAGDADALAGLAAADSPAFPHLRETVAAACEIDARPAAVLGAIRAEGVEDFAEIFREFGARAGVYGFGDAQVRRILAAL